MKEHIKIDASVASHKGNIHSKNEEKFYLNGQYMDLNQQKDSTVKASHHNYKQSVYGIASGTVRGAPGEQAAFIAIEALSRYHLHLEENGSLSFLDKKQRLIEHLKSAEEKIKGLAEQEEIDDLGATMVGLIIDGNQAFGFSLGEEGFYMVEEDTVRKVSIDYVKERHYIGSLEPMEKILRITDEFELEQGDRLLLTSKDTYHREMEGPFIDLVTNLSTKDSIKAFIKELLNREEQKNLTALLVYVEILEGFTSEHNAQSLEEGGRIPGNDENHDNGDRKNIVESQESGELQGVADKGNKDTRKESDGQGTASEDHKEPIEESERKRIFEQRYRESQMLFNKKVQQRDWDFTSEEKDYQGEETEDALEQAPFTTEGMSEDFFEDDFQEDNEQEPPWRTRSKFLLVALLAVGVILMAFAFGTIRNLEQRILSPSAEEETAGDSSEEPPESEEEGEEIEAEPSSTGNEDSSEEGESSEGNDTIEDDEETPEEEASEAEEVQDPEATAAFDTYEVQSGDTLFSISRTFYGDGSKVEEIISLNNIEDINNIQVGDVLQLPPED